MTNSDHINPDHYKLANGMEVIDLTETLPFLEGNIIKYVSRAGKKKDQPQLQDLKKALWYLRRIIANVEEKDAEDRQRALLQGKLVNNEASSYTEPNNY